MSDNANPLLAGLKLPGRIFQLPSKGIFYKNEELDLGSAAQGEIHVRPMSAMDEIDMKNPDQLFSGAAISAVLKQCVDGVQKPTELLAKDVDAIMLFLRAVTYGPAYEFIARHNCEGGKEHSYVADIDQMIGNMKMIDPTLVDSTFTAALPNGQVVKLHPNRYQDVLNLIKANENKKEISADDQKKNLKMMLAGVITSVDGVTDPEKILEWIQRVPSPLVNRIGEKIEKVNEWGPDLKWTCKCRDCGEDFEVEIPINPVSFFTE
jgi:hypothetical protein